MEKRYSETGGLFETQQNVENIIDRNWDFKVTTSRLSYANILIEKHELDEDALFEYEKKVINFNWINGRYIEKGAIILENGTAEIFLRENATSQDREFSQFFSPDELKIAMESQVYSVGERQTDVTWAEMQVPGVYRLQDAHVQVFVGEGGKRHLIKGELVYDVPTKINGELELNEELTAMLGGNPSHSRQETQASQRRNPLESEDFARFRAAVLNNLNE